MQSLLRISRTLARFTRTKTRPATSVPHRNKAESVEIVALAGLVTLPTYHTTNTKEHLGDLGPVRLGVSGFRIMTQEPSRKDRKPQALGSRVLDLGSRVASQCPHRQSRKYHLKAVRKPQAMPQRSRKDASIRKFQGL